MTQLALIDTEAKVEPFYTIFVGRKRMVTHQFNRHLDAEEAEAFRKDPGAFLKDLLPAEDPQPKVINSIELLEQQDAEKGIIRDH